MHSPMQTLLASNALLMAVWRRKPTSKVIIHSDQGSQFTSHEWQEFLAAHNLEASMSLRRNCYDNAVAESFFHLLKNKTHQEKNLQNSLRSPPRRVRLHRIILQSKTQAC